jgi:transposase
MAVWKGRHHAWLTTLRFDQPAQHAAFLAYLHEVDHARDRVQHLETAIAAAITTAPPAMRAVIGALQTLRGVRDVVAVTVASEIGSLARFAHPRLLMGYSGLVPREHSSGRSIHRGGITKTGNAHLRRVMVEAAWAYRHGPSVTGHLRRRQQGQPPQVTALAWQAQRRLCARYRHFVSRGKPTPQIITAIARELLGFIWAIGREAEQRVAAA